MKKRLLACLLTAAMLVSLFPLPALAAEVQRPEWMVTAFDPLDGDIAAQTVPQGGEPVLPDSLTAYAYVIEDDTAVILPSEELAQEDEQSQSDGPEGEQLTVDSTEEPPAPGEALAETIAKNDPEPAEKQEPDIQPVTIPGVTWEAQPEFDPDAPGEYVYTPILPAAYEVAGEVELPVISVTVTAVEQTALQRVQAMIDTLPTAEELSGMSEDEQSEVYNAMQAACDAYEALTDEQNEEITGAEIFDSLSAFFNGMVNLLEVQDEYNIEEGAVTITDACGSGCPGHTITGTGASTTNTITVLSGTHDITLRDVNIEISWLDGIAAFSIADGATVNLTLDGENTLISGMDCAGLQVPNGAALVITKDSNGSLDARGDGGGAGIGGGEKGAGGEITISSGRVNATAYVGACIGGGYGGDGGEITINNGIIKAEGGERDAAIGGGASGGAGGTITINGGTVTATGGRSSYGGSAGIGGGSQGTGGNITITGGTVTATAGICGGNYFGGAGIGGGAERAGGNIIITGGTVTATVRNSVGGAGGIGNGGIGSGGTFSTDPNGNAFIIASPSIFDTGNQGDWSGVIFEGDAGQVYGDSITLTTDAEIPSGKELTIKDGQTLTVDDGVTLTNNGTINVESGGKLEGAVGGTVNWPSTETGVTAVSVSGTDGVADEKDDTIFNITLPFGTSLPTNSNQISITPAHINATVSIPNTKDSGATWTFTVTAEDRATTADYTIKVSIAPDPAAGNKADFTAATAGSSSNENGANGSFTFSVSLSKGDKTGDIATSTYAEDTVTGINGTITATPYQAKSYTVSVTASPTEDGTVSGGGTYTENASVTVTATTKNGYHFVKWTEGGTEVSNSASYTFTVKSNRTLFAEFEAESVTPPTPSHTHTWATSWSKNTTHHWHECTVLDCDISDNSLKDGYAPHTPGGWLVDTPATSNKSGQRHKECTVCGYITQTETIPATGGGGSSGGGTTTTPTQKPNIEDSTGGSTTVTPVRPGETATIRPEPDEGYEVDKITVTDQNGKPVEVTVKPDGTYTFKQPNGKVTIEVTYKEVNTPWNNPFADVSEGNWYYEAVRFVQEQGLMNGYSDGRFGANDTLSRAQLAQILFNKEGRPGVDYLLDFPDVAGEAWYTEAVRWATSQGIVGGYGDGTFGPNDPITREQLAVMLWRYSGSPAATNKELHFNDTDEISGFALEALRWAVENGILNGYGDGRLGPQGQATRAQVAQMLKNFIENQEEAT